MRTSLATPRESPASWLNRQPSAATRREILALFSRHAFVRDLDSGAIARILPSVYVGTARRTDFETRAAAALRWAGPGAAIGGTAAAFLHGLLPKAPGIVTLCTPSSRRLRVPDWIQVKQPAVVGTSTKARGLGVVPVADALLQSWNQLGPRAGAGLILDAVRAERISAAGLAARAREYPRVRERRALSRLLDPLHGGVQSYLEHLAATRVFNTLDFAGFERQHRIQAGGRHHVLDLFDAEARLAVELDGRQYHSDDETRRRDIARDAELASVGIQTIRLTFEDVTRRPAWCRARVRQALVARRARRRAA